MAQGDATAAASALPTSNRSRTGTASETGTRAFVGWQERHSQLRGCEGSEVLVELEQCGQTDPPAPPDPTVETPSR